MVVNRYSLGIRNRWLALMDKWRNGEMENPRVFQRQRRDRQHVDGEQPTEDFQVAQVSLPPTVFRFFVVQA
jgi:hypothetical protein